MFGDMTCVFYDYENRVELAKAEVDDMVEAGEIVDIDKVLKAYGLERVTGSDLRYIMKNVK